MMHTRNLYQRYSQSEVQLASQKKLILLLYDGAMSFLGQARKCIIDGNIEGSYNFLVKARKIINELMMSLDVDAGGELATNLFRLYWYMVEKILVANFEKSVEPIDEVVSLLKGLRDAWAGARFEEDKGICLHNVEERRLCLSG